MRTNTHIEPRRKSTPGHYARVIRDTRRKAKRVTKERREARTTKIVIRVTL